MSEFRFSRLVEIKEKLLEQKQRDLEMTLASRTAVLREIDRVDGESAGIYDEIAARLLTGKELSMLTGYLSYLDNRKERLNNEKAELDLKAADLRGVLLTLEMELKVLEKLRFRTISAMKTAQNRREQKRMDDLALRQIRSRKNDPGN
jgi:flagellar export protein FliJ